MPDGRDRPPRTRIDAEQRRKQIIQAAHVATLKLGLHDVRVADVADELGISTGLVHYHFDTKDELIEAMLKETAAEEIATLKTSIAEIEGTGPRLAHAFDYYLPSWRRDPSWILWIDVWGEALRHVRLRHISQELDQAWVDMVEEIIARGVEEGIFVTAEPMSSAWRLCAMVDGLGLQVVLHEQTMSRTEMRDHVRHAAALELGYDLQF